MTEPLRAPLDDIWSDLDRGAMKDDRILFLPPAILQLWDADGMIQEELQEIMDGKLLHGPTLQ